MSRESTADDGREEAYEDRGFAAAAADSGGVIVAHRYAAPPDQVPERELDRRAQLDAMQELADQGRPGYSIPWLGKAREKAKVRHRQWRKLGNGWSVCRRCAHPVPTTMDSLKIEHQEKHARDDKVLSMQAEDIEHLLSEVADLRAELRTVAGDCQDQLNVAGEQIAYERFRLDALLLGLGHPDADALNAAVDRVLSYARAVNSRKVTARGGNDGDDE